AMSDQDTPTDGSLVPAGRRELAPVAAVNPLVSRGLAELAAIDSPQTTGEKKFDLATASPQLRKLYWLGFRLGQLRARLRAAGINPDQVKPLSGRVAELVALAESKGPLGPSGL